MSTRNLIDNIKKGDAQKSNNVFNSIMHDKIIDALDTHKQEVASTMYGASNNDTPAVEEPAAETEAGEEATNVDV